MGVSEAGRVGEICTEIPVGVAGLSGPSYILDVAPRSPPDRRQESTA